MGETGRRPCWPRSRLRGCRRRASRGRAAVLVDEVVGVHLEAAEERAGCRGRSRAGVGIFGVLHQLGEQDVGVEEVDAHGGVDHVGVEGRAQVGGLGLLDEAGDLAVARDLDDAEAGYIGGLNGQGGEGDVGAGVDMLPEHAAVVHLVDVVAGEDEDVFGLLGADGVDVLVDGVGGAHVPVGADALHGGQDLDELAELLGDDAGPAFADVAIEGERLVLGEDVNVAQVGVDAVGEGDVDDAVLAAERNGRLGAIAG